MMNELDDLRQQTIDDPEVPEMVRRFLKGGAPLEDIRLSAYGQWRHEGDRFENKRLANLFHRSLKRTSKGTWVLEIPPYTYPVTVELTDTFISRLETLSTQTRGRLVGDPDPERWVTVDLATIYTDGDDLLACRADGKAARLVDSAYRTLAERLDVRGETYVIRLDDAEVEVQPLPEGFFA